MKQRTPETSREAYCRILPIAGTDRERVFQAIRAAGPRGLIDDEGQQQTGIIPQTWTPRRGELAAAGLIVKSGERRLTRSGRWADVWVAEEFAPRPRPTPPESQAAAVDGASTLFGEAA